MKTPTYNIKTSSFKTDIAFKGENKCEVKCGDDAFHTITLTTEHIDLDLKTYVLAIYNISNLRKTSILICVRLKAIWTLLRCRF